MKEEFGWEPQLKVTERLTEVVEWTLENDKRWLFKPKSDWSSDDDMAYFTENLMRGLRRPTNGAVVSKSETDAQANPSFWQRIRQHMSRFGVWK